MARGPTRHPRPDEGAHAAAKERVAHPRRPRYRKHRTLVVAGALLLTLLGGGLALHGATRDAAGPAFPTAAPTVDPRLIIRPRWAPLAAVLSHGVRLTGTLYPGYPGRNTLRVDLQQGAQALGAGQRIFLVVTMPGMAMPPLKATLVAHAHHYVGDITLAMFGTYRAHVVVDTPAGRLKGTLTLPLSLPRL